jgi:hypothetical protein
MKGPWLVGMAAVSVLAAAGCAAGRQAAIRFARRAECAGVATPVPAPLPQARLTEEAIGKATVSGKYQELLHRIPVPADAETYGEFYDYGFWDGTEWAGFDGLPKGYWVYVYPNWYIWGALATGPAAPPTTDLGVRNSAAFSRDGREVNTYAPDGTARVWDAATGKPVTTLRR